jgi:uncharacterized protein YdeI (YjbR/CyaY-like superfamily)
MSKRKNISRWEKASHAMQSGVAMEISKELSESHSPKHLRTGVNVALCDHGSLVKLLIKKGILTEDEYFEAIADGMEQEKQRYEQILSNHFGTKITLA